MPSQDVVHARLYFLVARDSNKAVIFKRGPSDWTQLIGWDLRTDVLQYGQRFHGRIHEMRSDISPNGEFLLYFAAKYGKTNTDGYADTWTAVSRIPCLTALAMWPLGHTWYGGGYFMGDQEIMLNHLKENAIAHPNHQPRKNWIVRAHENREFISSDDLYLHILQNHGWETLPTTEKNECILQKKNGKYMLEWKRSSPDFTIIETFTIIEAGRRYILEHADHADWDHSGRLLIAKHGRVYAAQKNQPPHDAASWNMVADLNGELAYIGKAPDNYTRW